MSCGSSAHAVLILFLSGFCCSAAPYDAGSSTVSTKCGIPNGDSTWLQSAEELDIAGSQRSALTGDSTLNKGTPRAPRLELEPGTTHGARLPGGTASECWQVLVVARHADLTEDFCSGTITGRRTILTSAVGVDPDFEVSPDGRKTNTSLFICACNAAGQTPCSGGAGDPLFCYSSKHQVQYLAGLSTAQVECGSIQGSIFATVALYVDWTVASSLPGDVFSLE